MDLQLTDKVVLITGGSKGIGLACARAFAAEGAQVAIASRSEANLTEAAATLEAEGVSVLTVQADLTDPSSTPGMVAAVEDGLGAIDVLVNSAGAAKRTPPEDLTAADWHAAMDAKYFPYIHAMDAVIKSMGARGSGAIVNVIGAGGKLSPPTHLTGGGANAALMLVTAGLANAYAAKGVRVNGVNPGSTLTGRVAQAVRAEASMHAISEEDALRRLIERAPLGRLAEPSEIADVVVFLASPRASYVTGAIVAMDGAATPTVV